MQQTKPTRPPTKSWLDRLLEQPILAAILLVVVAILALLICTLAYLLLGVGTAISTLPTPTRNVGFATPTGQASPIVTPPAPGSASIALLPVQGDSGTLITITGQGWTPGDTVSVQVDDPTGTQGLVTLVTNVPVAANGTFIASFLLPADTGWANLTTVRVTAASTTTATRTAAEFSVVEPSRPTPPISPTPVPSPSDNDNNDNNGGIVPTPTTIIIPSIGDWQAEYYDNTSLSGSPAVVRNEIGIDFTWGSDGPSPDLPASGFSARWLRSYDLEAGQYIFNIRADDGIRLWVNDDLIIDEWFVTPPRQISADYFIRFSGRYEVRIEYANFTPGGTVRFWLEKVGGVPPPGPPYHSWRGAYWPNVNLFGEPLLVRDDPSINFDWGTGAPAPGMPNNNFSVRWDRLVDFAPDSYRFTLVVDDGARVWIDDRLIIDEWRDGVRREVSRDYALSGGTHAIRVEYYDRIGDAVIEFRWSRSPVITPTATPVPSFPDWKGEYWPNANLAGQVALTRNDPVINFNWGYSSPDSSLPADNFSVRWSRTVNFSPGLYRFTADFDDGLRFYVDGGLVLNEWSDAASVRTRTIDLSLNGSRQLVVEYYDRTGNAQVNFSWELIPATATPTGTLTPSPSATATGTATGTGTATPTDVSTTTPTLTLTHTPTGTSTETPTATLTATATITMTATITP
ncbi:MAG: hypothetical protein KDI62_21345 [Anaerolineae bacterium]|nr:hypothetical protein [Anaerolineae bacterium]MCB9104535.1 hypothetical protein [Anaerolineales bacterium]